jgi:mannose-1-phosphate guanylyltransferase/mannose-6-phosphate isomerase
MSGGFGSIGCMSDVFIGILSGGSGSRLWPLSRKKQPKQFYALAGEAPLLVESLNRTQGFASATILTTKELSDQTQSLLEKFKINASIIGEPAPLNTAPVISVFNELCLRKNPNAIVCIFPSDHLIGPQVAFDKDFAAAIKLAAEGKIVTFGIKPHTPSTAYGYLSLKAQGQNFVVEKFLEKPNMEKAAALIEAGALWNSGIFIFKAQAFKKALQAHAPEIALCAEKTKDDLSNLEEVYKAMPSISIDYALMEKLSDISCIKASFEWSDLGSWEEISLQNKAPSKIKEIESQGNFYLSAHQNSKTTAFIGCNNLVAVDTPDALLILNKGHGQDVKKLVDALKTEKNKSVEEHLFEERPWGRFEILMDTDYFKSKLITVWPSKRLSYQSHKKRMEHWIIVAGEGEFTLNDEIQKIKKGDHLFIPLGAKHRIANTGNENLEFVEVQLGSYFGEDDIIRYSDDYGRN